MASQDQKTICSWLTGLDAIRSFGWFDGPFKYLRVMFIAFEKDSAKFWDQQKIVLIEFKLQSQA